MKDPSKWPKRYVSLLALWILGLSTVTPALAVPLPGGTLDPTTVPKYVQPLVIPPEMPKSTASPAPAADYDIAVRQFKQQILPGGLWNALNGRADAFPATTVWSYGRAEDLAPDSSAIPGGAAGVAPAPNSTFNYPAFTVEATSGLATNVRWINDLKDANGNYLPHLLPVDQTLHWANPPMANCVMAPANRTDCETAVPTPYTGPVPFVTHVHGAHVQPHSDGFPEAWWLPAANNIPAGYAIYGSKFDQANRANTVPGSAYFSYENTQPATTLWYHDHALGMTRLNVYAGPAGFWLLRGGTFGDTFVDNSATATPNDGVLPGPAPKIAAGDPNFNAAVRATIREVPIAIQDRSFNADGSLFYPSTRTFFDGFTGPFIGGVGTPAGPSDISPIWNPEAFFNTMVVNGTTWPKFEVASARYRLRLLDGCNSRTLNLSLFTVTGPGLDGIMGTADDVLGAELPFYQIGAEQGFLPKVVQIKTGFATQLPGNGTIPAAVAAPDPAQALLMGPAERADVIVDFTGLANGTRIRMLNKGPDVPFGGFPILPADLADAGTTGQVMDFIVNTALAQPNDANTTPPQNLILPVPAAIAAPTLPARKVSLNEMSSDQVCVEVNAVTGAYVRTLFSTTPGDPNFQANCAAAAVAAGNIATPMGPRQALLGVLAASGANFISVPKRWADALTETPALNTTEDWEIYNTTVDAHPIHLHLVAFQVINRQAFDPLTLLPLGAVTLPNPNELGFKDTVVALPGQITRIRATFDIPGMYVWHCHIVEHEDNEMMRPMVVKTPVLTLSLSGSSTTQVAGAGIPVVFQAAATPNTSGYEYRFWVKDATTGLWTVMQPYSLNWRFMWTPPNAAGQYGIQVDARQVGSTVAREKAANIVYTVAAPAPAVTLATNVPSPQNTNVPITFTATGSGGSGAYQYRFWLKTGANWAVVQNYSATNTWTWTPAVAGTYYVQVDIRNVGNTTARQNSAVMSYVINAPAPTVTLAANKPSPQTANTAVTFTATGAGGSGSYQYRFWLKTGVNWVVVQNYSATNTWTWTPTVAGTYYIQVDIRNTGNTTNRQNAAVIGYTIKVAPTTVTLAANVPSPQPAASTVTFTATGAGGSGSYQYRFWLKTGSNWAIVKDYSASNTWTWPATAPGAYGIQVDIRNAGTTTKSASANMPFVRQ